MTTFNDAELVSATEFKKRVALLKTPPRVSANGTPRAWNRQIKKLGNELPAEKFAEPGSQDFKQEQLRYLLNHVKREGRIECATVEELINHMNSNLKQTMKFLRPKHGCLNLAAIFQHYAITNMEEENVFLRQLHRLQTKVNKK